MTRKLLTLLAAILLPGGLIALFGFWAVELAARTPRGQRALHALPAWMPMVRR